MAALPAYIVPTTDKRSIRPALLEKVSTMSSVMDPLNLVLLAIAAIIAWRLYGMLGTRTGLEKPPLVLRPAPENRAPPDNATPVEGEILEPENRPPVWQGYATAGSPEATGLEAIAERSQGFTAASFIGGAKSAYEMVLEAYAKGDKSTLKSLLSKEMMDSFGTAIDTRKAEGQSMTFQFVGVKSASIKRAELMGKRAQVDVAFAAEMISATLDKNSQVVDGDAKAIRTVTDFWTFERDVTAKDPNWKLVATEDDA
jgi:predicted lipid-binding transport protein (Tim44 family)